MKLFDKFKKKKKEVDVSKQTKEEKESKDKKSEVQVRPEKADKPAQGTRLPQHQNILVKPLISEKSSELGKFNQYVFEVAPYANKITVKKAIREVYGLTPTKVRMLTQSGKSVRSGRVTGVTKFRKKAVVSLKKGDKIQVFEGV